MPGALSSCHFVAWRFSGPEPRRGQTIERSNPFATGPPRVRAAADDVPVTLEVTPGVPHVFQGFAAALEEADQALNRAATFMKERATAARAVPTT